MGRAALAFLAVALVGCALDLPAEVPEGLACDDDHACQAPRVCLAGRCLEPSAGGGSAGGGAASGGGSAGGSASGGGAAGGGAAGGGGAGGGTAGGGTAGGGAAGGGAAGGGAAGGGAAGGGSADAGIALWSQKRDGFFAADGGLTSTVLAQCALEVDRTRNNKVVSTIQSAVNDRATANQLDAGFLPRTGHGRLRGRFEIPSTLKINNLSTFMWLGNANVPTIALAFNGQGQLVCTSEAGMLGPTTLTQQVTWTGGFQPNVPYLVDVTWRRGQYRRVFVNGMQVMEQTNLGDAGPNQLPDRLMVGIRNYQGNADAGWTITLTDWQLDDDPNTVLAD